MLFLTDDILTLIAKRVSGIEDRKSFSLVCKQWCKAQRSSRSSLSLSDEVNPLGVHYTRDITRFPNLVNLELSFPRSNDLTINLEYIFQSCPKLEIVSFVTTNHFDFFKPRVCLLGLGNNINRFSKLSKAKLVGNFEGDSIVGLVHSARNLKALVLGGNHTINDEVVRAVRDACCITTFKLVNCSVNDLHLSILANGSSLSSSISILKLENCQSVTDSGLAYLAKGHSISETLKKLFLSGCDQISDYGLQLLRNMKTLEHLDLSNCEGEITDYGITEISMIETLKVLSLADLRGLSDFSILALVKNCRNLETLDLMRFSYLSEGGIRAFSGHKCLKCLVLIGVDSMCSDADLESIALGCPSLESVIVDNCKCKMRVVHERTRRVVKISSYWKYGMDMESGE